MFAVPFFLAGLIAVGVPVAIHLLARQRTLVLPWGAMEFLRESITSASSRRNRLRDFLLLLLRFLAILFLVLTFAQPLASRLIAGASRLETVFVWDVSLSTNARDIDGNPLHAALKDNLLEELDRLPNRSSVRILLAGAELRWLKSGPLKLSRNNRKALEEAIRKQTPDSGGSQLANAILLAVSDDGDEEENRIRDVVVVQDFQRRAWQEEDSNRWEVIHQRLASDSNLSLRLLELESGIAVEKPQVAVVNLETDRDTVAVESPVRLRATLLNDSGDTISDGEVSWLVDGREVERTIGMVLAPNAELKLEQVLSFDAAGFHRVECLFDLEDDLLPEDNRAVAVVSAREGLPVLIIDDTARTQRGQVLPSEFLVASLGGVLGKKPKDGSQVSSLFKPRVIPGRDLNETALEGQLAVVIAKADSIPEEARISLQRFVEKGGGLWLMMDASEEALPEWSAELLDQLGLDPMSVTTRKVAENPESLIKLKASNPASDFAVKMASRSLDLYRTELLAIHELDNPVFLKEEELLKTPDGGPILLSLPVGAGRVLLQTTDLSRANTNFPVLQSFVPFVREATRECVREVLPPRNLEPGQPIRIPLMNLEGLSDSPVMALPGGTTRGMEFLGGAFEVAETLQPGVYVMAGDTQQVTVEEVTGYSRRLNRVQSDTQEGTVDDSTGYDAVELFSVRRPAGESKLDWLSMAETEALLQPEEAPPAAAGEERREGKWPIAIWFAILAALLFLGEAILAHRIVAQRDQSGARLDLKPVF